MAFNNVSIYNMIASHITNSLRLITRKQLISSIFHDTFNFATHPIPTAAHLSLNSCGALPLTLYIYTYIYTYMYVASLYTYEFT